MGMNHQNKHIKRLFGVFLTLIIFVAVFAIGFRFYVGNYYRADLKTINEIQNLVGPDVHHYYDDNLLVFMPDASKVKAVIVFYPGGKVEFKAYSGLMYELADRGYLCLLPRMPENLAFLRVDAVDMIKQAYPSETDAFSSAKWYLAGHSLGGVAASQYLYEHLEDSNFAGLILCASYTTEDFSQKDLRLLSIYGSEDKVLNMDSYIENKKNWPEDNEEYVIQGGIHSFFGNYGIQADDGTPAITNEQQIREAADVIAKFCE
jgi:hypothetical protein